MAFRSDLVYTWRTLRKSWGFSLSIILILTLCIGANTAIYSLVQAIILKPLPYDAPDELVMVPSEHRPDPMGVEVSTANFLDWQEEAKSFEHLGVYAPRTVNLTSGDIPERIRAMRVTPSGLAALGVEPMMGRLFTPDEEGGENNVAILSYQMWRSKFGSDPDILDKTIQLGDLSYPVVGVMPEDFYFPDREYPLWLPVPIERWADDRADRWLYAFGRLAPGYSVEDAQSEMDRITASLAREYPTDNEDWGVAITPLHESFVGDVKPALWLLLGTVFLVLIAACANIVNLQLARATTRRTEIAIRSALGASTSNVVRQLFFEGLILSLVGGLLGLLLANWSLRLLVAWGPDYIPRLEEVTIDGTVLAFTLVLSVLTGVVFGMGPALAAMKPDLVTDLREGSKASTATGNPLRLRRLLTVAEVVAAVVLMIGAGLLLSSLNRLQGVDPGFNPENVTVTEIVLPWSNYPEDDDRAQFFKQLAESVRNLPGVQSAGGVSTLPLSGANATLSYAAEGHPPDLNNLPEAGYRGTTTNYFETFGIPLIYGRTFEDSDNRDSQPVVVINKTLADRYWPDQSPVGKLLYLGPSATDQGEARTIIGVVGEVRHTKLNIPTEPEFYVPYSQLNPWDNTYLVVRSEQISTASLGRQIAEVVKSMDSKQPISTPRAMTDVLAGSISEPKLYTVMLSAFAGIVFLLSVVGIYSIISYSVAQRRHEIGIRVALGAERSNVLRSVIREGLQLAAIGIVIGLFVSWVASHTLGSLLYEVAPNDPLVFTGTAVLLAVIAIGASFIPAFQASRVDPMIAFRDQ